MAPPKRIPPANESMSTLRAEIEDPAERTSYDNFGVDVEPPDTGIGSGVTGPMSKVEKFPRKGTSSDALLEVPEAVKKNVK